MHVLETCTYMHVLLACICTQTVQIFQISCKVAHEVRRIKKYFASKRMFLKISCKYTHFLNFRV
jgi:hypothetical protein